MTDVKYSTVRYQYNPIFKTKHSFGFLVLFLLPHTYDVLADAFTDVHSKFKLTEKLTRTTTENGLNFVKAFVQFSIKVDILPNLPPPVPDPEFEDEPELQQLVEGQIRWITLL
jgi:hypothetical protein